MPSKYGTLGAPQGVDRAQAKLGKTFHGFVFTKEVYRNPRDPTEFGNAVPSPRAERLEASSLRVARHDML